MGKGRQNPGNVGRGKWKNLIGKYKYLGLHFGALLSPWFWGEGEIPPTEQFNCSGPGGNGHDYLNSLVQTLHLLSIANPHLHGSLICGVKRVFGSVTYCGTELGARFLKLFLFIGMCSLPSPLHPK